MKRIFRWELLDYSLKALVERYCHNCGKKAVFKDSGKRRHNANGKDIYEYAIYKCEKNHTWNMVLEKYKSTEGTNYKTVSYSEEKPCIYNSLDFLEAKEQGIKEIEIILDEVVGKWRIDKLLGERTKSLSRNKICELIKSECILLDGKCAKHGSILKRHQKITILIPKIFSNNIPEQL